MFNQKEKNIWIILLNWNGYKDTIECLKSLQELDYQQYTILIVDNGSTDQSVEKIRSSFPKIPLLENHANLGFAEGNNRGILHALAHGAEGIFLLNNDTVVDRNILKAFLHLANSINKPCILGTKIYQYYKKNSFDHLGGIWNRQRGCFDLIAKDCLDDNSWDESTKLDYICGCALYADAEIFRDVGFLEKDFFLIWEETDWCFRARKKGYTLTLCPEAKVWHKGSASFSGKPHSKYFFWRNRLLWAERNLCRKEYLSLIIKHIIPEAFHIFKLLCLRTLHLYLAILMKNSSKVPRLKDLQRLYAASICGLFDYLRRHFEKGPKWLYQKKQ